MSKHFVVFVVLFVGCLVWSDKSAAQRGNRFEGCPCPVVWRSAPICPSPGWYTPACPCQGVPVVRPWASSQCPAPAFMGPVPGCPCPETRSACWVAIVSEPLPGTCVSPCMTNHYRQVLPAIPDAMTWSMAPCNPEQTYTMERSAAIPSPSDLDHCLEYCSTQNGGSKYCADHCVSYCLYYYSGGPNPGRQQPGCIYWSPMPSTGQ
jgi:hypothetical protein